MSPTKARELIVTEDGSHTLYIPEMNEHYHSTHGAILESQHVYIEAGLHSVAAEHPVVFEVGFGTGLNAFLSLTESEDRPMTYISVEKYPLIEEEYSLLNYSKVYSCDEKASFLQLHRSPWGQMTAINSKFNLLKIETDLDVLQFGQLPKFDVIYFDAFAPNKQNDLWTKENFKKIFDHCNPGALFVTYCAQGNVRRTLQEVGFEMERLPGPPGKREMLRGKRE